MSRLFDFKDWLSVSEAARYLSVQFGEEVTEADVLRLALDGHLSLSVNFVNSVPAKCGKIVSWEETEWKVTRLPSSLSLGGIKMAGYPWDEAMSRKFPPKLQALLAAVPAEELEETTAILCSEDLGEKGFLNLSTEVVQLVDVWDLPMQGAGRLEIERMYYELTEGPEIDWVNLDGVFVEGRGGVACQLQSRFDGKEGQTNSAAAGPEVQGRLEKLKARAHADEYYPADVLPEDSVVVIRTAALQDFGRSELDAAQSTAGELHMSEKLSRLNQAARRFWGNADPAERGTHPNNEMVAAWLVDRGFTRTLADKAATIIRPSWAPTGRKPDE